MQDAGGDHLVAARVRSRRRLERGARATWRPVAAVEHGRYLPAMLDLFPLRTACRTA
jgi:hypothetical protein